MVTEGETTPLFVNTTNATTDVAMSKSQDESTKDKNLAAESVIGATFLLANSTIGSGVLGLPFVIKEFGLVTGLVLIALGAVFTSITMTLLYYGRFCLLQKVVNVFFVGYEMFRKINPTKQDYEDVGDYCYGKWMGLLIKISVILINFGATISYMVIVGSISMPVLQSIFGKVWWLEDVWGRFFVTLVVVIPVIMMSCSSKMSNIRIFAYIALAGNLLFCLFIAFSYFFDTTKAQRKGSLVLANLDVKMIRSIGVILFAFSGHTNLCPIAADFRPEKTYM
jgi:sodium-coupled neutral amino acid transporter 11